MACSHAIAFLLLLERIPKKRGKEAEAIFRIVYSVQKAGFRINLFILTVHSKLLEEKLLSIYLVDPSRVQVTGLNSKLPTLSVESCSNADVCQSRSVSLTLWKGETTLLSIFHILLLICTSFFNDPSVADWRYYDPKAAHWLPWDSISPLFPTAQKRFVDIFMMIPSHSSACSYHCWKSHSALLQFSRNE